MTHRKLIPLLLILAWSVAGHPGEVVSATQKATAPEVIAVPFEMVNRHVLIKVKIKDTPLWFIFDTGDKVAILDLDRAKQLGLILQGEVNVGGAGPGSLKGSFVRDASLNVVGIDGHPQPVVMAVPLGALEPKFGHDIDGIIGGDFIKQFVVEVDYPARVLRFHDKDRFNYSGPGEMIPISFSTGHPVIPAEITVNGRSAIKGKFVIDVGSGGSLILHRPFVEQERLRSPEQKTIASLGGAGAGGKTVGRVGRISALKIGKLQIENPMTMFSEDKAGAFANPQLQGNIGQHILSKFTILLDYGRERIIFEPNATFKDLISPASSGVRLVGEGSDYKTFRVDELLEESPASEAGLRPDDLLVALDGRPAGELTLSAVNETLEKPVPHKVSVRRGAQTLQLTVTPRRLI